MQRPCTSKANGHCVIGPSLVIGHCVIGHLNFSHPHFAEPHWLWLAALAPLAVLLLHRYAAWARKKQLALFAAPELISNLLGSHSPVRRALKNLLLGLAIAGTGLALSRPQWGDP